ncbi:MAG: DUF421 domain-containing protein [Oscillospiraceae bacterium]|jgi:uncharacterized membrane protein YcaP (DUF421 family)|nr:DUF421 domain-containing protein [Oscillospiraceae bacterium]
MLILFLRTAFVFVVAVFLMRVMGKRQIAQLQPYELVLAILMADIAAAPMGNDGIPLLDGIVPMLALVFLHTLITYLCMKSERLRRFIDGSAFPIVSGGRLRSETLDKLGITVSDLLEELRAAGYATIEDVHTAILETSGKMSVFNTAVPVPLILSGQIMPAHLKRVARDEAWLHCKLAGAGISAVADVALCQADENLRLVVYRKGEDEAAVVIEV